MIVHTTRRNELNDSLETTLHETLARAGAKEFLLALSKVSIDNCAQVRDTESKKGWLAVSARFAATADFCQHSGIGEPYMMYRVVNETTTPMSRSPVCDKVMAFSTRCKRHPGHHGECSEV